MGKKLFIPLTALSIIGLANFANAARKDRDYREKDYDELCPPEPGAPCFPDDAPCAFCLGPDNAAVNPAVNPLTCNGDIVITVAGFYWNSHQDGMEYAIDNEVLSPPSNDPGLLQIQQLNNLVDAEYKNPNFKWDFGFKLGLAYNSTHDGWDLGVLWTWYKGRASSHIEAESSDNHTLLPLWTAFPPVFGSVVYCSDIEVHWKFKLNLFDIELGREFWTSRYLIFRPHFGLRIAFIDQNFHIEHKGGVFSIIGIPNFIDNVELDNDFKGIGLRGGLDTTWNFGRGWALYGNLAGSIVYGRFDIEHKETVRVPVAPNTKIKFLETDDSFRASCGMLDLAIGIQWSTMFSQCRYGFTAMLGWEHHLFFDQNQMWRIVRIGDVGNGIEFPNNSGENVYSQRKGDLSTQGWTLTFRFEF